VVVLGNGPLDVVARLVRAEGGPLEARTTLRVDGAPPDLVVIAPAQGEMVAAGGRLALEGVVTDPAAGVMRLDVDGQAVVVGPGGRFATPIQPRQGLNVVRLRATDARGNVRVHVRAFHYAGHYRDGASADGARVDDAVVARLAPAIFEDLGYLLGALLAQLDLQQFLPEPLARGGDGDDCVCAGTKTCTGFKVSGSDPRFQDPIVELTPQAGGLHVVLGVSGFEIGLALQGRNACSAIPAAHGNATAAAVVVEGDLDLALGAGVPSAALREVTISVEGLKTTLDLGPFGVAGPQAQAALRAALEAGLRGRLDALVPGTIARVLSTFSIQQDVALPAPLEGGTVSLGARFSSVGFTAADGRIGLGVSATGVTRVPAPGPGSVALSEVAALAPPTSRPLAIALHLDLVNELLYAAWRASGFSIDATALVPRGEGLVLESLRVDALLPPLLLPNADGPLPLQLEIGGVRVRVRIASTGGPLEIEGLLHLRAEVGATAHGNRLQLQIGRVREAAVELLKVPEGVTQPLEALNRALETALPEVLADLAAKTLHELELPAVDLSKLGVAGVPPGISLGLDDLLMTFDAGHVYLAGKLVAR